MIFTFYSFKGGVGRSMAVANVADVLHRHGLRVVIIDWDLEAPGLENFFLSPDDVEQVKARPGLIDVLLMYQRQFASIPFTLPLQPGEPASASAPPDDRRVGDLFSEYLLPLTSFLQPLRVEPDGTDESPGLWMLSSGSRAGEQFASYARSVQNFDWAALYEHYRGEAFFEWLRTSLVADAAGADGARGFADVVLVDARTGVTEMGGICTRQLADVVVALSAPNYQNLVGTVAMAESFRRPEVLSRRKRPLKIVLVPTRVENSEIDARGRFQNEFIKAADPFIPAELRRVSEAPWNLRIPYIPKFVYEESLVAGIAGAEDLEGAYKRLAADMALLAPENSIIRARFADDLAKTFGVTAPRIAVVYVAENDREVAQDVFAYLQNAGLSVRLLNLVTPFDRLGDAKITLSMPGIEYCVAVLRKPEDAQLLSRQCRPIHALGIAVVVLLAGEAAAGIPNSAPPWLLLARSFHEPAERRSLAELLAQARAVVPVPYMVPALPERYVERTELMSRQLESGAGAPLERAGAATLFIFGAPGSGKSVFAAAFCRHEEIDDFPDGTLWLDIGPAGLEPDALAVLHTVVTGETRRFTSAREAVAVIASDLAARRCLVVADGVGDAETLDLVQRAAADSTLIVATRNFELVGAHDFVRVGAMQRDEALALLSDGVPFAEDEQTVAVALAAACCDWPLLLAAARKLISQKVRHGQSRLVAMASVGTSVTSGELAESNSSVAAAIQTALDAVSPDDRKRFEALAVFTPQPSAPFVVPLDALPALWDVAGADAEELAARLADASLVELDLGALTVRVTPVLALHLVNVLNAADLDDLLARAARLERAAKSRRNPALVPSALSAAIAERKRRKLSSVFQTPEDRVRESRSRGLFAAAVAIVSAAVALTGVFAVQHVLRPAPSPSPSASASALAHPAAAHVAPAIAIAVRNYAILSGATEVEVVDFVIDPRVVTIRAVDAAAAVAAAASASGGGARLVRPTLDAVSTALQPTMAVNGGGRAQLAGGQTFQDGLLVSDGRTVSAPAKPPTEHDGVLCVSHAGKVTIGAISAYRPGTCEQALQGGPLIIEPGGKFVFQRHSTVTGRTLVGLDRAGKLHVLEARADLFELGKFAAGGGPGLIAAMNVGYPGQSGITARVGGGAYLAGVVDVPIAAALVIVSRSASATAAPVERPVATPSPKPKKLSKKGK